MKYLITGSAGFIGFHMTKEILSNSNNFVLGIDNMNNYYDPKIKRHRLKLLSKYKNFKFKKIDIKNNKSLEKIFKKSNFDIIIHLAAQAGVRYSFANPKTYFDTNILGFYNLLDCIRMHNKKIKHFLFASTSSVYGDSKKFPTKENSISDCPLSFYSASKKSNEVMAYSFSNMYKIPITCMRFFTVYGPYGRPDMAIYKFTNLIKSNKPIKLHNSGNHSRDFTYIDDTIKGIKVLVKHIPKGNIPFNIFNVASGNSIKLKDIVLYLQKNLNTKIKSKLITIQKGDVLKTHADISLLNKIKKNKKVIGIEEGIKKFLDWHNKYYDN